MKKDHYEHHRNYVDQDSSHVAKIGMLTYVIASLILCGGSVFGFTPLKQIFLDEGVYRDLCFTKEYNSNNDNTNIDNLLIVTNNATTTTTTTTTATTTTIIPCEAQLVQLDRMFTLAASLFSAWLLPAGLLLRYGGPRLTFTAGFALVAAGCSVFAQASPSWYTAAYVLIGTGNPLLYIAAFNFGKLYPHSSNLLLSIFIGCFGFSSVIFYLFHQIYFAHPTWSSRDIFRGFVLVPMVLAVVGWYVLPPDPYHIQYQKKLLVSLQPKATTKQQPLHDDDDEEENESNVVTEKTPLYQKAKDQPNNLAQDEAASPSIENHHTVVNTTSNETHATTLLPLEERSILQQLLSAPFWAQTVFFCWGMLHQNFYLATLGDQIFMFVPPDDHDDNETTDHDNDEHNYDDDDDSFAAQAVNLLQKFALLYPLGCLLSILPVGTLVRNTTVSTSLWAYCTANLVFSTFSLIPVVQVQWITSSLYIMVRVAFFTIMSTYSATLFGFRNLSAMFGCAGCMAGLSSLAGVLLSHRALYVDHSFVVVNSALLVGAVLNFALPFLVRRYWE